MKTGSRENARAARAWLPAPPWLTAAPPAPPTPAPPPPAVICWPALRHVAIGARQRTRATAQVRAECSGKPVCGRALLRLLRLQLRSLRSTARAAHARAARATGCLVASAALVHGLTTSTADASAAASASDPARQKQYTEWVECDKQGTCDTEAHARAGGSRHARRRRDRGTHCWPMACCAFCCACWRALPIAAPPAPPTPAPPPPPVACTQNVT
jgi:hypothetical protein